MVSLSHSCWILGQHLQNFFSSSPLGYIIILSFHSKRLNFASDTESLYNLQKKCQYMTTSLEMYVQRSNSGAFTNFDKCECNQRRQRFLGSMTCAGCLAPVWLGHDMGEDSPHGCVTDWEFPSDIHRLEIIHEVINWVAICHAGIPQSVTSSLPRRSSCKVPAIVVRLQPKRKCAHIFVNTLQYQISWKPFNGSLAGKCGRTDRQDEAYCYRFLPHLPHYHLILGHTITEQQTISFNDVSNQH
jgi:hypothetical protein